MEIQASITKGGESKFKKLYFAFATEKVLFGLHVEMETHVWSTRSVTDFGSIEKLEVSNKRVVLRLRAQSLNYYCL